MKELLSLGAVKASVLGQEVYLMEMKKGQIAYASIDLNVILLNKKIFDTLDTENSEQVEFLTQLLAHEKEHLIRGPYTVTLEDCKSLERLIELYLREEQLINKKVAPIMYESIASATKEDLDDSVEDNAIMAACSSIEHCKTLLNHDLSKGMIDYIKGVMIYIEKNR